MSSPYTPYNHNAVHAEFRDAARDTITMLLTYPPNEVTEETTEDLTDALLEVLATTWLLGVHEGMEECCGMGAFPNPYVRTP